eukprot:1159610-Pelagomonas_calceolata.AAC.8
MSLDETRNLGDLAFKIRCMKTSPPLGLCNLHSLHCFKLFLAESGWLSFVSYQPVASPDTFSLLKCSSIPVGQPGASFNGPRCTSMLAICLSMPTLIASDTNRGCKVAHGGQGQYFRMISAV